MNSFQLFVCFIAFCSYFLRFFSFNFIKNSNDDVDDEQAWKLCKKS